MRFCCWVVAAWLVVVIVTVVVREMVADDVAEGHGAHYEQRWTQNGALGYTMLPQSCSGLLTLYGGCPPAAEKESLDSR